MIVLNLIVGIVFGVLTPWLERKLRDWSEQLYLGDLPVSAHEFDVLAVLAIVMIAAIVCAVLGIDSAAFLLALGIGVGLFGKRIWHRIKLEAGPGPAELDARAERQKGDAA